MKKFLQILKDGQWKYVFCNHPNRGVCLTSFRRTALLERDLEWFQMHYANDTFRVVDFKNAPETIKR